MTRPLLRTRVFSHVPQVAVTIVGVILGLVLVLAVWIPLSSTPGHSEIHAELRQLREQMRYQSCVLLIPDEKRVPEAVSKCQVPDP